MAPTNGAMSAYNDLNRFSIEDEDMTGHTGGKWVAHEQENSFTIGQERDGGELIAETAPFFGYLGAAAKERARADALRIEDCVNACEGMDDPATEIADIKRQRDELLAALDKVSLIASDSPMTHNMMLIYQYSNDAIANAKGAAK